MRVLMRGGLGWAAVWLTVWLAGCAKATNGPEPLPLDRVNCARCGMLISSDANAAEAQTSGDDTRFYDDIGCLARDPAAAAPSIARFVRLAGGAGWATTESAWFAFSASARTPMAHGILAFAAEADARAADREGRARTWTEIASSSGEAP